MTCFLYQNWSHETQVLLFSYVINHLLSFTGISHTGCSPLCFLAHTGLPYFSVHVQFSHYTIQLPKYFSPFLTGSRKSALYLFSYHIYFPITFYNLAAKSVFWKVINLQQFLYLLLNPHYLLLNRKEDLSEAVILSYVWRVRINVVVVVGWVGLYRRNIPEGISCKKNPSGRKEFSLFEARAQNSKKKKKLKHGTLREWGALGNTKGFQLESDIVIFLATVWRIN